MPTSSRTRHRLWPTILAGQRPVQLLALLLVSADLVLMAVHGYATARQLTDPVYYVDADRSHGEILQYLKFGWLLMLTALLAVGERSWRLAAWLPLFAYFLLDDAFTLHERLGGRAAEELALPAVLGLRPVDLGEHLVSAVVGIVVLLPVALAAVGCPPPTRRAFQGFAVLVGTLLLFGIAVDSLHVVVIADPHVGDPMGLIEDGGEMLATTALVLFALRLNLDREASSKNTLTADPSSSRVGSGTVVP